MYDTKDRGTLCQEGLYMSMQNDLSFIIDSRLSLYEHQSTYNPNIPLRFLMYLSDLYEKMIVGKNVYGKNIIQIPAPKFIVFYNGRDERPEREMIKLSDAYMTRDEEVSLELCVDVLNINVGSIEEAVDKAIDECIKEDILREFLERNRAEAKSMSIYEYDQEEHIRLEREEAYADGRAEGRAEGCDEGIALAKKIFQLQREGFTNEEIAEICNLLVSKVVEILS